MGKRLLLIFALLIGFNGVLIVAARADISVSELTEKVKALPLNQGVVFSLKDSEFSHASSAVLFEKWNFGAEVGYIDNGKLLVGVSYKLLDLKDYVSIPLVKELTFRPGVYLGLDEINDDMKADFGVSFSVLTLTW